MWKSPFIAGTLAGALAAALILLPTQARADGAVTIQAIPPISEGPSDFPDAYHGFGYGAEFFYFPPASADGGSFRISKQGDGEFIALAYKRYFFSGRPPLPSIDTAHQTQTLEVRPRFTSYFFEAGGDYFHASRSLSTPVSGTETIDGLGVIGSVGMERPMGRAWIWGARLNLINGLGTAANAIFLDLSIGLPLSF